MVNTFNFSYFIPTPDATANCALSRWNDGVMGLSDFLKSYMASRQSIEFGFSRNLNISELLNLAKNSVTDSDGKYDYTINYHKYGDIKATVCGFEIPILDFMHPFLELNWLYNISPYDNNDISYFDCLNDVDVVTHVFNHDCNLNQEERIAAALLSFNLLKNDVQNLMTDNEIAIYFCKKYDRTPATRTSVLTDIDTAISTIENMSQNGKDFIFGYKSKEDLTNVTSNSSNILYYRDTLWYSKSGSYPNYQNFPLRINTNEKDYILSKYFYANGIDVSFSNEYRDSINSRGGDKDYQGKKGHVLIYFKFTMFEEPSLTPFVSHDGTKIPLSKQTVNLSFSKFTSIEKYNGRYQASSMWNSDEECPIYYDENTIAHLMTLDSNNDGMGGRDYTFWTSPVQKTAQGYKFECCMPLAFYNEAFDSYSNEYYATKAHEGVDVGQVMYRVPVVKRMRHNIEEAIVNTHIAKCLNDITPVSSENSENDDTVLLGGVVVDDFTQGLYPVVENYVTNGANESNVNIVTDGNINLISNKTITSNAIVENAIIGETEDGFKIYEEQTYFNFLSHLENTVHLDGKSLIIEKDYTKNYNASTSGSPDANVSYSFYAIDPVFGMSVPVQVGSVILKGKYKVVFEDEEGIDSMQLNIGPFEFYGTELNPFYISSNSVLLRPAMANTEILNDFDNDKYRLPIVNMVASETNQLFTDGESEPGESEPTVHFMTFEPSLSGRASLDVGNVYAKNLKGVNTSLYGDSDGAIYFFKLGITNHSSSNISVPRGTNLRDTEYFNSNKLVIDNICEQIDNLSTSGESISLPIGVIRTLMSFNISANTTHDVYVPCIMTAED